MKRLPFFVASVLVALPIILMGCGGGGGSSPSVGATATPRPTTASTPVAGAPILVVQLQDGAKRAVDGIVTVGTATQATTSGSATFRGLAAGTTRVSAEVDGQITTGSAVVKSTGTTFLSLTISPSITPAPSMTPPPPPF